MEYDGILTPKQCVAVFSPGWILCPDCQVPTTGWLDSRSRWVCIACSAASAVGASPQAQAAETEEEQHTGTAGGGGA